MAGDHSATALETIEITRWTGPFPDPEKSRALAALECGKVLHFPNLAFEREESGRQLLSPALADSRAKNISLDPVSGSLRGTLGTDQERLHLQAMIEAFAAAATRLVSDLLPCYASALERARTSYRPV
jgi:3-deoxy-D-manno-oct-2-ulosonic acid (Kdo) hydroxylase